MGLAVLDELLEKSLPKKSGQEKNRHVATLTFSHLSLVTFLSIGGMNKSEGLKTVWKSGRLDTVFIFPQPLKDLFLPPYQLTYFFYFQKLEP